jgi:hypothetical protein
MMRSLFPAALAAAVIVIAPAARADNVDAATRSTARKLGLEGVKLYDAGNYAAALEKFNTADSLMPAPTLGLFAARCLVKLGKLVEASERYLEVTRMQLDRNALPVMRKAQSDAVAEREKLMPTIPSLEIHVEGPAGDGVAVAVDGKVLLPGLVGEKRPVNPGKYRVEARRADTTVAQDVTIALGEAARTVLKLPPLPPPPTERMPPLRAGGWTAIGIAGAGVVAGSVAGLVAVAKGQSLLAECPRHMCPDAVTLGKTSSYDAARAASTAGFIAGAVALAIGIPLLVVSPKTEWVYADGRPAPPPKDAPPKTSFETWITWGGAGARVRF